MWVNGNGSDLSGCRVIQPIPTKWQRININRSPFLYIDWGDDEPGMTLQRRERKWVNYKVDGKTVKSPVDIDALPLGRYRLV
jgi:hypothetical protein